MLSKMSPHFITVDIDEHVFRTFCGWRISFQSGNPAIEVCRLKVYVPVYWVIICAIFNVNPFEESSYRSSRGECELRMK